MMFPTALPPTRAASTRSLSRAVARLGSRPSSYPHEAVRRLRIFRYGGSGSPSYSTTSAAIAVTWGEAGTGLVAQVASDEKTIADRTNAPGSKGLMSPLIKATDVPALPVVER